MLNNNVTEFDYVIIIPGRTFSSQTVLSLIQTTNYLKDINASFFVSIRYSPVISIVRNSLITQELFEGYEQYLLSPKTVLPFGGKSKTKKIIMIDSDISWTVQDFKLLVENDNDITVAPYKLLSGFVSVGLSDGFSLKDKDLLKYQNPFDVKVSGLGFASIKLDVFEKIKYPWFSVTDGDCIENAVGEDVFFCRRAIEEGFTITCDPRIKVGHIKQMTLYI
jgi:hypothetical protein